MTNSDFGELVWENGHIVIKGGQFSKVSDAPNMDISTNSKTGNLTNEAIGRYDDGDVFPWFYHLDDPLHHDSASGFLAETSGVTSNGLQCFTKFSVAHKLSDPIPCSGSRVSNIAGNGVSKHAIKSDSIGDKLYEMRLQKKQDKQVQPSNFTLFANVARARNDPESAWAGSNEKIMTHGIVAAKDGLLKETNDLRTDATRKCSPSESVDKQTKAKLGEDGLKLNSVNGRNEPVETKKIREPTAAPPSLCSDNNGLRASNNPTNYLKRKHNDEEDCDSSSEDAEEELVAIKKAGCKRNRAAEVHNFTERKRREEINDKMRSLQELIPNCNKVDKATMLDEVIEYLRMLQFQVQMMSMRPQMCTSPIIPQSGLQHLQTQTHLQQFMPMGFGMGMGYQSACFPGPSNPSQQLWNAAQRIHMPMPPLPGAPQTLIPGSVVENPNSQNPHLA